MNEKQIKTLSEVIRSSDERKNRAARNNHNHSSFFQLLKNTITSVLRPFHG
ncbi:MAG TPA: hypothetical protein VK174_10675 [Chitinophagales bacterium]|nr:hypothetical protein [Chitinophagales bacterium]